MRKKRAPQETTGNHRKPQELPASADRKRKKKHTTHTHYLLISIYMKKTSAYTHMYVRHKRKNRGLNTIPSSPPTVHNREALPTRLRRGLRTGASYRPAAPPPVGRSPPCPPPRRAPPPQNPPPRGGPGRFRPSPFRGHPCPSWKNHRYFPRRRL